MSSLKDFFINGTDRSAGTVIDMTVLASDFSLPNNQYFFINPETVGIVEVQLFDGSLFTITAVQTAAYLGFWYPVAIIKVFKAGTSGTFSFAY
jgi:hypothetical protein